MGLPASIAVRSYNKNAQCATAPASPPLPRLVTAVTERDALTAFAAYTERRAHEAASALVFFLGGGVLFVAAVFAAGFVAGYWIHDW